MTPFLISSKLLVKSNQTKNDQEEKSKSILFCPLDWLAVAHSLWELNSTKYFSNVANNSNLPPENCVKAGNVFSTKSFLNWQYNAAKHVVGNKSLEQLNNYQLINGSKVEPPAAGGEHLIAFSPFNFLTRPSPELLHPTFCSKILRRKIFIDAQLGLGGDHRMKTNNFPALQTLTRVERQTLVERTLSATTSRATTAAPAKRDTLGTRTRG